MLYFVHTSFSGSIVRLRFSTDGGKIAAMTPALFDQRGNRKYLVARERLSFVYAASKEPEAISTFCLTLAFTGARISEVLALTARRESR
jgi:hypothetical protein